MTDWKQQVRVQLETVTPLFLGGADPRGEPELRPSAFRGAMRYWFRAALGGVIGDKNLDGLRTLEREVFGDAEYGSPVSIQVQSMALKTGKFPILPHKPESGYRSAFYAGQKFQVVLQTTRPPDPITWVNACMAFNLAILLGGVGLRSRRGAGSLRIVDTSDPNLVPSFPNEAGMFPEFTKKITRSALGMAKKLAEHCQVPVLSSLPASPTAFPCIGAGAEIRFVKDWANDHQEALAAIMRKMPRANFLGGISPRQGSPLWVNVLYASRKYHLLLSVLPSRLASGDQNYQNVSNLLQSFGGEKLEIKGWNV